MKKENVGIAGLGVYIPNNKMTAKELSDATKGVWSEEAVIEKLGIVEKKLPAEGDGSQIMGVYASLNALKDANISAEEIDCVLCITEEWKEYPLTTSANHIIQEIGATNAWGIDVQNRCCTSVSAMKLAKDILIADDEVNAVLVAGGYRNCDVVDYEDSDVSMMFDLAAGGGAIILKKNMDKNLLLGTHIISDGSLARSAGSLVGGINQPVTPENMKDFMKLRILEPNYMKNRLKEVSSDNWIKCIDKSFEKSGIEKKIDFLAILHFKRSAHYAFLKANDLTEDQSIYLENYGHIGQIDQILSLHLALQEGKVKDGDNVVMLAAGIGYTWASNVIKWGKVN